MPQLNPSPWMIIFLFTWLIFLAVIPVKVLSHIFPNPAQTKSSQQPETTPWAWPWY